MSINRAGHLRRFLVLSLVIASTTMMIVASVPVHASTLNFGASLNLSNDPSPSGDVRTATSGNNVYIAWLNNTAGNSNILFRASSNNGTSFGPVARITNSTNQNAANQQIASTGNNVYLIWQQNSTLSNYHIYFRASTNNGASFGPVINVTSGVSCGGGCGFTDSVLPQIAFAGNNVYVVWLATTSKGANDIMFKASTTNGSNLATVAATTLTTKANGPADTALSGPQITATGTSVYLTWCDTTPGRPQTFFAASSNSGTSFGTPFSLSSTPTGETDYDQQILATGTDVYVAWTNDTVNSDNTMFSASTNSGANFGAALNLNKGTVTDLNPELAVSGNSVYVVWSDTSGGNTEVLYRLSSNNGASFASIVNLSNTPQASNGQMIVASGTNVYVSWVETAIAGTDIYFASSSDSGTTFGTPLNVSKDGGSLSPVVTAGGGYAYVAWESGAAGNGDIIFSRGSPGSADVAITAFSVSRNFAYNGVAANPTIVNVTAANKGTITETFNVTAFANVTVIGVQQITLLGGATMVVSFNWHPELLPHGTYMLSGQASAVPGETNTSNNVLSGGSLVVRLGGDVNNDCTVNIQDLATVAYSFNTNPSSQLWNPYADLNNDGQINIVDLANVAINWNKTC